MSPDLPPADVPLLLLPVHLETHLRDGGDDGPELLVRVFPDDVHVDTHEPGLTAAELGHGRSYWQETWRAGTGTQDHARARRRDAWARLVDRLGPARAGWAAEALRPRNPGDRPTAAVPAGDPLPVEPDHPPVERRDGTWTRAARARLLPDRWLVLGHRDGRRVLSHVGPPVPDGLAVGPDPAADAGDVPDDEPLTDPGTRWVVDLEEAERVGMALRVPLDERTASAGLDTLVVVGVRAVEDPVTAARGLAGLLHAHHGTDGLARVAPWTPTNDGAERSGRRRRTEPWWAEGPGGRPAPSDPGEDDSGAGLLRRALGLPPLPPGADDDGLDARSANAVLWPATWGYALEHLVGTLPDDVVEAVRRWWLDHVRPGGPLPTVRAGAQPYGVLPVAALDRWSPADAVEEGVVRAVRALRPRWRDAVAHVPRVRRDATADQVQRDLLHVLGHEAVSGSWEVRPVLDRTHAQHVAGGEPDVDLALHARAGESVLRELGLGGSRVADLVLGRSTVPLLPPCPGPRDEDDEAPDLTAVLAWLREADVAALVDDDRPDLSGSPAGMLLRHAVLTAYASAARRVLAAEDAVARPGPEDALVPDDGNDGTSPPRVPTLGGFLDHGLPGTGDGRPLREVVHGLGADDHSLAGPLDDLHAGLDHLAGLSPTAAQRLVAETVDACSHRLDAWATSVASAGLARRRAERPDGVRLGSFGWVEDLRPGPEPPTVTPPDGEADDRPLLAAPGSPGHVHAPSLAHAATAAILRSGHAAHPGTREEPGPLAVDLSSHRVRLAQELRRGVGDGRPLAAVLGYRFERGVRELGLHRYLPAFRLAAPLTDLDEARARVGELELALADAEADEDAASLHLRRQRARRDALDEELRGLPTEAELRERAERLDAFADLQDEQELQPAFARVVAAEMAWTAFLADLGDDVEPDPDSEEVKDLQRECAAAHAEHERIEKEVEQQRADADAVRRQADRLPRRKADLERRLSDAEGDVVEARQERNVARGRRRGVEADLREAQGDVEDLESATRDRLLLPPTTRAEAVHDIAARDVVDGLALLRLHEQDRVPWGRELSARHRLPAREDDDATALRGRLDELEDAVDALGDIAVAEAVFQTVQGDADRAAAALDAATRGTDPPPEPEVVRTPVDGVGVTYRVVVLLPASSAAAPGWSLGAARPRAVAEPRVEAWAGSLLGDPRQVRWTAVHEDDDGRVLAERRLRLADTGLCALDLVDGSAPGGSPSSALVAALRHHARRSAPDDVPPDAAVHVRHDGMTSVLEVAHRCRRLLAEAEALDAGDLTPPGGGDDLRDAVATADVQELTDRADAVVGLLRDARDAADGALSSDDPDPAVVRDALAGLAAFGIGAGAARLPRSSTDRLVRSCRAARSEADARVREASGGGADGGTSRDDGTDDTGAVAQQLRRVHVVLGESSPVLPVARVDRAVGEVLADPPALPDPLAPLTWLQRVGRVRDGVDRLTTLLLCSEALGTEDPDLRVAQLPHRADEPWVALPAAGSPVPAGRLSVVAHRAGDVDADPHVCGLVVDEWTEVVPARTATTALAVPYPRPPARAPQCLLLAVPPDDQEDWDLDTLEATLLETVDLAHLRAVDPDALAHVRDLTFLLPAVHVAVSSAGDDGTVSTDLARAAAGARPRT